MAFISTIRLSSLTITTNFLRHCAGCFVRRSIRRHTARISGMCSFRITKGFGLQCALRAGTCILRSCGTGFQKPFCRGSILSLLLFRQRNSLAETAFFDSLSPWHDTDAVVIARSDSIPAQTSVTLAQISGPGMLESLHFVPSSYDPAALDSTWLNIYWDKSPYPAVHVPLMDFFLSPVEVTKVRALQAPVPIRVPDSLRISLCHSRRKPEWNFSVPAPRRLLLHRHSNITTSRSIEMNMDIFMRISANRTRRNTMYGIRSFIRSVAEDISDLGLV